MADAGVGQPPVEKTRDSQGLAALQPQAVRVRCSGLHPEHLASRLRYGAAGGCRDVDVGFGQAPVG